VDLTAIRHFVSSAKMKGITNLIHSVRSLIKMTKSRGPSTLPCGTPESTLESADIESSILTHWNHCCKYSLSHNHSLPVIPIDSLEGHCETPN